MKRFYHSASHAVRGLGYAIYSQRNLRIHLFFALLSIFLGAYFTLTLIEWGLLFSCISLVIITELINTSIELSVDLTTKKQRIRAKLSKDIAAGAVLFSSFYALSVGYLIFYHRLVTLMLGGS